MRRVTMGLMGVASDGLGVLRQTETETGTSILEVGGVDIYYII